MAQDREKSTAAERETSVLSQARDLLVDPRTWRSSYPIATALVIAATLIRFTFDDQLADTSPMLAFSLAVLFSAMIGGFGPGIYATAASGLIVAWFFMAPDDSLFVSDPRDRIRLTTFGGFSFVLSVIGWREKRNRERLVAALDNAQESLRERIEAQRAQQVSEGIYRAIGESIDYGVWVCDGEGRNVYASQSLLDLIGITREECAGFNWAAALHPDDAEATIAAWKECVRTGCSWERQHRYRGKDGRYHHVLARGEPIRDSEGRITAWAGINLDIRALKQVEDALRRSEREFRTLANFSPQIVWAARPDGHIDFFNERWYEFTGARRDEFGREVRERVLHPDDLARARAAYDRAIREGVPYDIEYRFFDRARGGYRWFLGRATPLLDEQGVVQRWIGTSTDIDDLKRQQVELQRLSAIVQNARDFVGLFDSEGRAVFVNPAGRELIKVAQDESLEGRELAEFFAADMRARVRGEVFSTAVEEGRWSGELALAGAGASTGSPVFVDLFRIGEHRPGAPASFALLARDVTERQRAEAERERLLESERAARVDAERAGRLKDEFLATLSHELRTPLNAIVGWAHLVRSNPADAAGVLEGIEVIERNARAQSQLISDLLDMSRITSGKLRLEVRTVELPAVIEGALASLRPAADAKGVRLQSIVEPIVEPLHGDPARLQQVVWNLVSNSLKFTPKGGRVQVVLARVNSHVEIAVSDTGRGIRLDFLPHLFERFRQADASASREYAGLGIGLALVKHLVELHGGTVRATSPGEGQGATFTVELPLSILHAPPDPERQHPRAQSAAPIATPAVDLRGVRVLVVDDEQDALEMVKRLLEANRAEVAIVSSADQALELLGREEYDVLLSDIGMPRRDGLELIAEVRRRGWRLPAAAVTAFARAEDRTRALRAGFQSHVSKPVEPAELVAIVAALARRREH